MAPINTEFLRGLERATLAANRALGVSPSTPRGAMDEDLDGRTNDLHDAARELLLAVESLENWAADVTRALRDLGVEIHD